jgi:asparagine synthase (glutamine-hydrolysing)
LCGIAGFFDPHRVLGINNFQQTLRAMGNAILHRGPDAGDIWYDEGVGLGLSHRRLSIIDLSAEGNQPMHSACGRYVIAFNGEVYNFQEIRSELERSGLAPVWRGHSDTEVMLSAISNWGLEKALGRFNGMFGIALWDKAEKCLSLIRDRLGKKPIYYTIGARGFAFGSELKALMPIARWDRTIDRQALTLHLRYGYIPQPHSIYTGARKLPPATILTVALDGSSLKFQSKQYWSETKAFEAGAREPFLGSYDESLEEVDALLEDSVRIRSNSDVPLGMFLSGGIDSSLVSAKLQSFLHKPLRTFSIGFEEKAFDESSFASTIANHLGTDHTEFRVTSKEAMDVIPLLPSMYDEPFADASQIPTYLVSKLARSHVTVALSGDGGDELFAGYTRYLMGQQRWSKLNNIPSILRKASAMSLRAIPSAFWDNIARMFNCQRPDYGASSPLATRIIGLSELLGADSQEQISQFMMSIWRNPGKIVLGSHEPESAYASVSRFKRSHGVAELMMIRDAQQYLPDDILVKVDRASMAASLEVRSPLLDYRLFELAWKLPLNFKLQGRIGKVPLRHLLGRHVPEKMYDRPKMGFGVPMESWLRGPLRQWAEDLLSEQQLKHDGLLDVPLVRDRWNAHKNGMHNWSNHLWHVLTVQSWLHEGKSLAVRGH